MTATHAHNVSHSHASRGVGAAAPAPQHGKDSGGLRGYITGAGAISIEFLLELLKLNTLIRNDMTQINMSTTNAQNAVFSQQGQAAIDAAGAQSQELTLQSYTSIAGAVTSGLQVAGGLFGGFGTKGPAEEASMSEDQLTSYNKVATSTDLMAGDGGENFDCFKTSEEEIIGDEDKANIRALRDKLQEGRFNVKEFGGQTDLEHEQAELEMNGKKYNVAKVIRSATAEERAEIGKKFVNSRDNAIKNSLKASQNWQQVSSIVQAMGGGASGAVDSWSKTGQAAAETAKGAAQAVQSEAQGTSQLLTNAQKSVSDQRDSANQNVTQALQGIREIVQSDVRG